MQDALSGEMVRRQELLRDAGNFASVRDYERARAAGEDLAPLPSLFIVVDEFSEMLSAKPEFIDLFVAIGRLGRSLGLHLLLASQRLEEGRLRGLESHLSYRIGLRTFSAQESRSVLGVPDAYELPPMPGLGFLKPDQSTLLRFKAAYVSGPPAGPRLGRSPATRPASCRGSCPGRSAEVRAGGAGAGGRARATPLRRPASRSRCSTWRSRRMDGFGPAAHQVWLPPLDVPDTLDELMADLAPDPELGLVSRRWRALGGLTVPLGTVDRPREQRRDTLTVDLSGAGGHVAVVGGPRSGKSTLLRTLVTSLSLTTTPSESQFFVLDFGGGTFAAMRVAAARRRHRHAVGARRRTPDRRRGDRASSTVARRTSARNGIDSIETYRSRRAPGPRRRRVRRRVPGRGRLGHRCAPTSTTSSCELQQLASRGLTFGFHVVTAASPLGRLPGRRPRPARHPARAAARRPDGLRDRPQAGRAGAAVAPGRGLVPGRLHFLAALPRIDGDPDVATLGDGVET